MGAFKFLNSSQLKQNTDDSDADEDDAPQYCDQNEDNCQEVLYAEDEDIEWCDVVESNIHEDENELVELTLSWPPNVSSNETITNGCLAHLLQLAVKDGIKTSPFVVQIIKKVNDIVKFLQKSTKLYSELRKKTNGLGLVKPCATRWTSTFQCLRRISSDDSYKDRVSF